MIKKFLLRSHQITSYRFTQPHDDNLVLYRGLGKSQSWQKKQFFLREDFISSKLFFLFFIPLRNTLQKTTNYGEPCWLPYIFEGVLCYADFCVRIRKSSVRRAHACMRQHRMWKILILPVKRNKKNCLNKKKKILRERKKF